MRHYQEFKMSEYLYGLIWAIVTVAIIFFGHWVDFIPEQPDYFIQVQR